jgi:hypothetical protein
MAEMDNAMMAARTEAIVLELIAQRDQMSARAANLAGDVALLQLRIKSLETELAKANEPKTAG